MIRNLKSKDSKGLNWDFSSRKQRFRQKIYSKRGSFFIQKLIEIAEKKFKVTTLRRNLAV